jgi:hypothetical protein
MKAIVAILCILMMSVCGITAYAQTAMTPATDTVTNAATRDLSLKIPGTNAVLTFQLNVVKLSGTTAGTAFVQGSLDGVNYVTLPGSDTLTLANASVTKAWVQPRSNFLFYRIRVVGSGTQSTQLKGLALYRN